MDARLNEFIQQLSAFRKTLDEQNTFEATKKSIQTFLTHQKALLLDIESIDHHTLEEQEKSYVEQFKYAWSLDALDLSILIRDSFLQLSTLQIKPIIRLLEVDYSSMKKAIVSFPDATKKVLDVAIGQNQIFLENARNDEPLHASNPPQWFHQNSPIPTVVSQLDELYDQIQQIYEVHEKMCPIIPQFNKYREHLIDHNNSRLTQLRALEQSINEAISLIQQTPTELTKSELTPLSNAITKISEQVEKGKVNEHKHNIFSSQSGEIVVPIYANSGELYTRSINLDKNVELWSDTEILPKMLDADFDISNLFDSAVLTLFNTHNKIESLSFQEDEKVQFDHDIHKKFLIKIRDQITSYKNGLDKTIMELNTHAMNELQLENIYHKEKEFLPELGFINLTKYTGQRIWYETNIWSDFKMRVNEFLHNRKIPFISNLHADPYDFIQSKQLSEVDLDNNSLFLKNGYLGKSFYLPRKVEEQKIIKNYSLWKKGYQGSVLIVGSYGSGKSTLIENIPNLLPEAEVVQIVQNNVIQLKGRKHLVHENLQETISFIEKQSITTPVVACIDDLERFQSDEYTLYNTINDLVEGIAKFGKRIFFVISTNHFMLAHIKRMFDFESRFAETMVVDKMYQKTIANAIVIRHNASLKDFSEEANRNAGKKAARLARLNRYNIGASMLSWERQNDDEVREDIAAPPSFYQLVNRHSLILKIILANKFLKESTLRNGLTPMDNNYVSEELRKLMGYKIINRTYDGYLQVDAVIVHEVEACLKNS